MCVVAWNALAAKLPVSVPDGWAYVTFIVPNAADGFELEEPFAFQ
jgi:hypothetical protein